MKKTILIFALVLSCSAFAAAQSKTATNVSTNKNSTKNSVEEVLIAKEKQKWEALMNGRWLELKDLFAEDFISIGYQPDGSVKMTTKADSFAATGRLPADVKFVLSDFKMISADKKMSLLLISQPDRSKFRQHLIGQNAAQIGRPFSIRQRCFAELINLN